MKLSGRAALVAVASTLMNESVITCIDLALAVDLNASLIFLFPLQSPLLCFSTRICWPASLIYLFTYAGNQYSICETFRA